MRCLEWKRKNRPLVSLFVKCGVIIFSSVSAISKDAYPISSIIFTMNIEKSAKITMKILYIIPIL